MQHATRRHAGSTDITPQIPRKSNICAQAGRRHGGIAEVPPPQRQMHAPEPLHPALGDGRRQRQGRSKHGRRTKLNTKTQETLSVMHSGKLKYTVKHF